MRTYYHKGLMHKQQGDLNEAKIALETANRLAKSKVYANEINALVKLTKKK